MSQIVPMKQSADGVWRYLDDLDAELCTHVLMHSGWELTYLDDFLNTESQWKDRPNDRLCLIRLRQRLKSIAATKPFDNDLFRASIDALYYAAEAISNNIAGCHFQLLKVKHSESQAQRRTGKGKALDSVQERRVKDEYDRRVANGEKYGALRDLATHYKTSETTIKKLVKKPK